MIETIEVGPLTLRFLISKHDSGGVLDMFEMRVPPAARMPLPHHHAAWEETVYGLEGVTTWTVDGVACAIGPGDRVFIPRNVVHGFANDGDAPTRCLCVLTPGVLGPDYFRELGAELGAPSPDPVKLKAIMSHHGLIPAPPRPPRAV